MHDKKQQLEQDMEWLTGSKLGKKFVKAVYCHPAYLPYYTEYIMWNARLDESQAEIKFTRRNINNVRCSDDITLKAESEEKLKGVLMRVKEESEKPGLKLKFENLGSWYPVPLFHGQYMGKK